MTATLTVSFKNQLAEIERLGEILTAFAQQQEWSPQFLFETNVAHRRATHQYHFVWVCG